MAWEVEYTDEFEAWFERLTVVEQNRISDAVNQLIEFGPALGRPFVDTIHTSRHAHMKELRPRGANIRILFSFNPRRVAILLLGGDKTNRWQEWYNEAIPTADRLYDVHLDELRQEGLL